MSGDVVESFERRELISFELSNPPGPREGDVPALLRRVADAIEELGDVEIRALVFHQRIVEPAGRERPFVVVYYRAAITPSGRTSAPAPP